MVDQGGIGLPEKDYYLRSGEKDDALRGQYVQHIANVLKLLGSSPDTAGKNAADIMAFETALAKVSMGNVERRDPEKIYHMEQVANFASDTPNLHMAEFLKEAGTPPVTELNVATPEFFTGLNQLIASTSLDTLKNYMRVFLVDSFSSRLPKAFDRGAFRFLRPQTPGHPGTAGPLETLCRRNRLRPRGSPRQGVRRAIFRRRQQSEDRERGEADRAAMERDLDQLEWMSPATKAKAHEKLAAIVDKIGYPNKWRDYSALTIKPATVWATHFARANSKATTSFTRSAGPSIKANGT